MYSTSRFEVDRIGKALIFSRPLFSDSPTQLQPHDEVIATRLKPGFRLEDDLEPSAWQWTVGPHGELIAQGFRPIKKVLFFGRLAESEELDGVVDILPLFTQTGIQYAQDRSQEGVPA